MFFPSQSIRIVKAVECSAVAGRPVTAIEAERQEERNKRARKQAKEFSSTLRTFVRTVAGLF